MTRAIVPAFLVLGAIVLPARGQDVRLYGTPERVWIARDGVLAEYCTDSGQALKRWPGNVVGMDPLALAIVRVEGDVIWVDHVDGARESESVALPGNRRVLYSVATKRTAADGVDVVLLMLAREGQQVSTECWRLVREVGKLELRKEARASGSLLPPMAAWTGDNGEQWMAISGVARSLKETGLRLLAGAGDGKHLMVFGPAGRGWALPLPLGFTGPIASSRDGTTLAVQAPTGAGRFGTLDLGSGATKPLLYLPDADVVLAMSQGLDRAIVTFTDFADRTATPDPDGLAADLSAPAVGLVSADGERVHLVIAAPAGPLLATAAGERFYVVAWPRLWTVVRVGDEWQAKAVMVDTNE